MPGIVSSASTLERPAILRQVEIPPTDSEHYIRFVRLERAGPGGHQWGLARCLSLAGGLRRSASGHLGR